MSSTEDQVANTPVKSLKLVDKALEVPLVNSAYSEVTRFTSPITPYVESTLTKVTPMVEVGYLTLKTQVEEKVVPHIPSNLTETVTGGVTATVDSVAAAVEKADNFACEGIDQLMEKVPQLKEATPKLIEETKETMSSYVSAATDYAASFPATQVALKVTDTSLEVVEDVLKKVGSDESGISSSLKKIHSTANTLRISGVKRAGTERAKKIEEATVIGALAELTGLTDLMSHLGYPLDGTAVVPPPQIEA